MEVSPYVGGLGSMVSGVCRAIAALGLVVFATAAMAQPVVPSSVQPGREQQRFIEQAPPLSQQGGTAISLPSTVAPKGADRVNVVVRAVHIEGMTVSTQEQVAP